LLNLTYNLDKNIPEKRICVMAPFHNLLKYGYDGSFHNFLKSIDAQNYSNYMVYMIDDVSTDDSVQVVLK
jgi:cellulose synthase/poly-beta-1,6-N-acetylglucosamine synthase-like glycosyltransferase